MTTQTHVPSRRTVLSSALGLGALGSIVMSADSATAALGDPAVPSETNLDFYLNLSGVPGAVADRGFEGQIQLLTWAWGVDTTASVTTGTGAGVGRPTPRDVVIVADTGIHSPKLLGAANTGRHANAALISCVKPGERPFTFLTLRFEEVLVSSYSVTPDPVYGLPFDLAHLRFGKVTYTFFSQKPDGTPDEPITSSFDYRTNAAS
jgi:type VI secretion system secreted protein Hcp